MPETTDAWQSFFEHISRTIPEDRLIRDPLRTLAFGTDASFYRLIPKIVIKAENEAEVAAILKSADRFSLPVTFRAAGTSLSGQAVSDSVLVLAGEAWQDYEILENGLKIRLSPGIIGAQANRYLAPYGRKLGPDPASINSAMIGGIAANNASGMCCGTAQNSYRTVCSVRLLFADGCSLDTADPASRDQFAQTHAGLLARLADLGARVKSNPPLAARIRHKYKIKNTTGYSLNALVDYEDPFDILVHLMIGSEGTLGFISHIVYHTVVEDPVKASALMVFADMHHACRAAQVLKTAPVAAVELMDRASLRSVQNQPGMPAVLHRISDTATALLVETRAKDAIELAANVASIAAALGCVPVQGATDFSRPVPNTIDSALNCTATELPVRFTADPQEYTRLWNIRKGLFPSVGALRRTGTTVIIEDVAFPITHLAEAAVALQHLFGRHGYPEAIIFGHALEGNLHFVFTPDLGRPEEVERYRRFMDELCQMVVQRFDGSLKAEHGTGRNMAPFVELEWGADAYRLMREIKAIFDPKHLLNPGVILNPSPRAHIENLKAMAAAHPIIDPCMECGFCEVHCPSKDLTLTPRHRIVVQREIARLRTSGQDPQRLKRLEQDYVYQGEATCAADGMCALACPVTINTGEHTKHLRHLNTQSVKLQRRAEWAASHLEQAADLVRIILATGQTVQRLLGCQGLARVTERLRRLKPNLLPEWHRFMPRPAPRLQHPGHGAPHALKVVYFPSCVGRTLGPAADDPQREPLSAVTGRVLAQAGYGVIYPQDLKRLCCGTAFESKGFFQQADLKSSELQKRLWQASQQGRYPVLCDTCPCVERMRRTLDRRLQVFDPVEFIARFLLPRLQLTRVPGRVAVHVTCSAHRLGLAPRFRQVAEACAQKVVIPDRVGCCGFAGDRGFSHPELNRSALMQLAPALGGNCHSGYSNSRTCEIGLSLHSGIHYRSILYLVDQSVRAAAGEVT